MTLRFAKMKWLLERLLAIVGIIYCISQFDLKRCTGLW